jgi:hypothetical protein
MGRVLAGHRPRWRRGWPTVATGHTCGLWPRRLLAWVLALTVGLFGITETLDFTLVPPMLVVESIGVAVPAVTTALAFRARRTR